MNLSSFSLHILYTNSHKPWVHSSEATCIREGKSRDLCSHHWTVKEFNIKKRKINCKQKKQANVCFCWFPHLSLELAFFPRYPARHRGECSSLLDTPTSQEFQQNGTSSHAARLLISSLCPLVGLFSKSKTLSSSLTE